METKQTHPQEGGSPTKKLKVSSDTSDKKFKHYKGAPQVIQPGMRGFLVTNTIPKSASKECYDILNRFADELYGNQKEECDLSVSSENIDISKQIEGSITDAKKRKKYRFENIKTGVHNLCFIKTSLDNPVELSKAIVNYFADPNSEKIYLKSILRLLPIEVICKANIEDIKNAAGNLFDKYFLGEPTTFSIAFNKRFNEMHRDEIIKELADLVITKNVNHKVDLSNAKHTVIVELLKGQCFLSVVPGYLAHKKHNLDELNKLKVKNNPAIVNEAETKE